MKYKLALAILASAAALNLQGQFLSQNISKETHPKTKDNTSLKDASRIGLTSGAKAAEFQELYDYENKDQSLADAMFPYQPSVHRAYVIMLREQNIISKNEASKILAGLSTVDSLAEKDASLHVYMPYEAALIKQIGSVGGKMHIGRSRNDLDNTTNRMFLRDKLLQIIESLIYFRETLAAKASENLETVMVAYTHRKEAQPITLAHYLMALDESFSKSLARYIELYARINQSPLGSGATGGTGWPLNRQRVSELLGFEGLVTNTIEGVAGWDHIAEFASDNAIYLSGVSRLASEIQLWSSDEYKMAELDNSFAGISSMMPQKKNPDALERSRKASNLSIGQLMSILSSLNAIEYQHSGTRYPLDPKPLEAVLAATHAMTGVIRTLHPNKEVMLRYAKENFSTMTDLADMLVKDYHIDFRDAHEVVAIIVKDALSKKLTADKITVSMVKEAVHKQLGLMIQLNDKQLQSAIDPLQSITRKTGEGMPSPLSVSKMINSSKSDIIKRKEWLNAQKEHLHQCAVNLSMLTSTIQ
ncbi:argininosuccinate lyase [Chryseobacterium sp. c4a]|uniref:argininosuccinate lyase n=1 Tax=Chryseobacterium sp. c4a TaxID=1573582 RepID=UPI00135789E2|nr:argininosuccinate lyase [Chryseobacterium sp. c4a]